MKLASLSILNPNTIISNFDVTSRYLNLVMDRFEMLYQVLYFHWHYLFSLFLSLGLPESYVLRFLLFLFKHFIIMLGRLMIVNKRSALRENPLDCNTASYLKFIIDANKLRDSLQFATEAQAECSKTPKHFSFSRCTTDFIAILFGSFQFTSFSVHHFSSSVVVV